MLLLASAATVLLSYEAADRLVHPPRERSVDTPASRGIAFEEVAFLTGDGLRLSGWWMPSPESRGTVVFLHGYTASKSQSLAVAPFLLDAGYSVLAFDFRAHGDSEGAYTTVGLVEAEDVRSAVAYLEGRADVDPARIALFGWSMGAAAALNAARDLPEVRAVIADSGFARLDLLTGRSLGSLTGLPQWPFAPLTLAMAARMTGRDVGENAPEHSAHELQRPLLVIQGLLDSLARPDADGERLATAAGEQAQLWLVPGAAHVDARREAPGEYEARVLAFLAASLDGGALETLKARHVEGPA